MDEEENRSLLSNLAKKMPSAELKKGELSFTRALEQMGYSSVFDILRSPKTAFVRKLGQLSDANAELAYENARCYATQIARIYRNELISSGKQPLVSRRTGIRSLVDIGPSFPNLFKENWEAFCKVGAIEAMDSPVAYLASLYRFATEKLEGASSDSKRILLAQRRPDIKTLEVDQDSTFKAIPMLAIVNKVLEEGIRAYVDRDDGPDNGKTVYELIAQKKHPFIFPYNFYHHQVKRGLADKKLTLGELTHRISRTLPLYGSPGIAYGSVNAPSVDAQMWLTNFSPEQRSLLEADDWPAPVDGEESEINVLFREHYATDYFDPSSLIHAHVFMEKTGLSAEDLEGLLALRSQHPVPSSNALAIVHPALGVPYSGVYGASYVSQGPVAAPRLNLTGTGNATQIENTTYKTFDRFQRFIRLQKWTKLPWAELDTLSMATPRKMGSIANSKLSQNTIRSLGVFTFFNNKYAMPAEAFAAIIHQIGIFSSPGKTSLFDQVFNRSKLSTHPLVLDKASIALPLDEPCAALIANGLHLSTSDPLFNTLLEEVVTSASKMDQAFVTSMYRQPRIAQLFNVPLAQLRTLVQLLGGPEYLGILKNGTVNNVAPRETPDLFDLLMQCDWAMSWINSELNGFSDFHELIIGNAETFHNLTPHGWFDDSVADVQRFKGHVAYALNLDIPSLSVNGQTGEKWNECIYPYFRESTCGFITSTANIQQHIRTELAKLTDARIGGVPWNEHPDVEGILDLISKTFIQLEVEQVALVKTILQAIGVAEEKIMESLQYAQATPVTLLVNAVSDRNNFSNILETIYMLSALRTRFSISRAGFLTFTAMPAWLDRSFTGPLAASLASVYLLNSYHRWIKRTRQDESAFTDYLALANATTQANDHSALCAEALAPLLDFPLSEVCTACELLDDKIAKSMVEIDWLLRVRDTSLASGLPVAALLLASSLTMASPQSDWQAVGSAAVADG